MENEILNQQETQASISPITPPPPKTPSKSKSLLIRACMLLLLLVLISGGFYYKEVSKVQQKNNKAASSPTRKTITKNPAPTITNSSQITGWKTYSDPNNYFSFQYPSSWTFKKGLDVTTDAAVYDPTDIKKWPTNGGGTVSWPAHFIDIESVEKTSKTAKEEVNEYEKSGGNLSDTQINRDSIVKNGIDYEFYNLEGESAVVYRLVAISDGNILIMASSSIDKLGDGSLESKILNTFQFSH
ncbi:MAG TPA: hypothetical protein VLF93_04570 [Candidatus Saccharimonadales bacterium]|nr:hypothetical protein [Candidatus Saccharimonadales bacterium]